MRVTGKEQMGSLLSIETRATDAGANGEIEADFNEQWKPCPGFEDHYAVSNMGRVMRTSPENRALVGRILKPMYTNGYQRVRLRVSGKVFRKRIHRLVAMAFVRNPNNYPEVHHKDGYRTHNWSANLEWLTSAEHHRLTELSGRTIAAHAERNINTKFTWEIVAEIRRRFSKGEATVSDLAQEHAVSLTTIKNLVARRSWKTEAELPVAA
jgi:hypothetical protein